MDICTLLLATTQTLQACMVPATCDERDGARWCVPAHVESCPPPAPTWDCVREDGTHYWRPLIAHGIIEEPN